MSNSQGFKKLTISRRKLLAAGVGVAAAGPYVIVPGRALGAQQIVFVGYGGVNQEWYEKLMVAEFTKDTGVKVIMSSGPDLAKLKAQVMTKNVEWDIMTMSSGLAVGAEREGLLEKVDYSVVKWQDSIQPSRECTFPFYTYWGGVAFDPKRFPIDKVPKTWADFWDAKKFPGRRGLRDRADEMLEIALMADGVPPKKLFPLDMDRAFKSLDRIKPHVAKFIAQTPQTISLVQTNEIDFSYAFAGRVDAAQKEGISMDFVSGQPLIISTFIGVPKGSKNREAAMKLMSYFARPDMQAAYGNALPGNGPIARAAMPMLSGKAKSMLPNADDPQTAFVDMDWWADNFAEATKRYKQWLLG
ncbi:MAG: ABC transporter substrate-binding protein [Alphaproteobacteria bacterium]|nr:ABC transporter substrate-binding protein [Alphaproteobacteria bacterium]